MTREELIEIVRKVILADVTEEEQTQLLQQLDENVPHPDVMDLIYWPPDNKDLTPEEIIDIALSYDWKANQNIVCSKSMKDLLKGINLTTTDDDGLILKYFDDKDRFDVRSLWATPRGTKRADIVKNNQVVLDENDNFEDMLNVVINFERYLKELYPNAYFQSYFIVKKNEKPFFSFHTESPNADWIKDNEVKKLKYPIRKNTF